MYVPFAGIFFLVFVKSLHRGYSPSKFKLLLHTCLLETGVKLTDKTSQLFQTQWMGDDCLLSECEARYALVSILALFRGTFNFLF